MSDCPRAPKSLRPTDDYPPVIGVSKTVLTATGHALVAALRNTDEEISPALSALALATTLLANMGDLSRKQLGHLIDESWAQVEQDEWLRETVREGRFAAMEAELFVFDLADDETEAE